VAPEAKQTGYGHLADLGGRLAELLPLKNAVRQRMLEINDPVTRLNHLEKLLDQMQATAEAQGA
jgi:Lon protease-like protein